MWAMIPMLRTRSSAILCSVTFVLKSPFPGLPAVVREGLVGLRHPVDVVLALERAALLVERVHDLVGELVAHDLLAPFPRVLHEPADGERARTALRHLDGHLVVGPADAAAANLEHGRDRLHGLLEHLDRRSAGLRADGLERRVDDLLGDRLLAVEHHLVDHLRDERRPVDGIGRNRPDLDLGTARQLRALLGAVLRARLLAVGDAARVERGADHLVPVPRQVLDASAADEHDRVLLQVVALAGDVDADLRPVREPHARDLAQRRVRLLRGLGHHARGDAPLLRGAGEGGCLRLRLRGRSALAHELIDSRHESFDLLLLTKRRSAGAEAPANRPAAWYRRSQGPSNNGVVSRYATDLQSFGFVTSVLIGVSAALGAALVVLVWAVLGMRRRSADRVAEVERRLDGLSGELGSALSRAEEEGRRARLLGEISVSIDLDEVLARAL